MNTSRKTATIVGALFLISYFGVIAGSGLLEPLLSAPESLANLYQQKAQVMIGVFLELVNGIAVVGIAVILYPLLKHYSEGIALGYVSMRVLECSMQIAMDFSPLTALNLSQEFVKTGALEASSFLVTGSLLLAERQSASLMLAIFFSAGGMLFYYLLYQSKLLPRFISVWGFVAVVLVLVMNFLEVSMPLGLIFALPIILNELFLAIWLIVKGFNPSTIVSESAGVERSTI